MAYIEYRIDNFGLQKHLPESVKKPIHRTKASSGIEKKNLYIEYFRLSILIRENMFFSGFLDFCSRPWFKPVRPFYIVFKKWVFQAHRRVPPTTGVVELWKKNYFAMKTQWNWVVFLNKLMNMFTGDVYSMYVVLQEIGSLSCIRVYIIYVIPFGE